MAAPARPTLPLTRSTRLARSGEPGWTQTAAILERGAVVQRTSIYRSLGIQLASQHRAARLTIPNSACLLVCLLARLPVCSSARLLMSFLLSLSLSLSLTHFLLTLSSLFPTLFPFAVDSFSFSRLTDFSFLSSSSSFTTFQPT